MKEAEEEGESKEKRVSKREARGREANGGGKDEQEEVKSRGGGRIEYGACSSFGAFQWYGDHRRRNPAYPVDAG